MNKNMRAGNEGGKKNRLLRKVPQSDADVLGSDGEWMIVRGDPQPHTRVPPASGKVKWPRLSLLAAAGALVIGVKMNK